MKIVDNRGRRDILLSPEEKERKEEKYRIKAEKEKHKVAEVSFISVLVICLMLKAHRKRLHEPNASINWWRTLNENLGFSWSRQVALMTLMLRVVNRQYLN